jgi:hypothetical protein
MSLNGVLNLQVGRREAKAITVAAAKGGDPLVEKRKSAGETLEAAAKDYLKREAGKLRTGEVRKRALGRLVYPVMGKDESSRSSVPISFACWMTSRWITAPIWPKPYWPSYPSCSIGTPAGTIILCRPFGAEWRERSRRNPPGTGY